MNSVWGNLTDWFHEQQPPSMDGEHSRYGSGEIPSSQNRSQRYERSMLNEDESNRQQDQVDNNDGNGNTERRYQNSDDSRDRLYNRSSQEINSASSARMDNVQDGYSQEPNSSSRERMRDVREKDCQTFQISRPSYH